MPSVWDQNLNDLMHQNVGKLLMLFTNQNTVYSDGIYMLIPIVKIMGRAFRSFLEHFWGYLQNMINNSRDLDNLKAGYE
jgi:hypothetical protein